jgi:hypothetical protein
VPPTQWDAQEVVQFFLELDDCLRLLQAVAQPLDVALELLDVPRLGGDFAGLRSALLRREPGHRTRGTLVSPRGEQR